MNDATPTRTQCRPAVRLSYDISEIEETLRSFGSVLEHDARSAVNTLYQQSLNSIYIIPENHVYHASEQYGDFRVTFKVTYNLFSATRIEYNPDGNPTGLHDGVTLEIPKDGDPNIVPSIPLTHTICFLSPVDGERIYTVFAIENVKGAAACAPPEESYLERSCIEEVGMKYVLSYIYDDLDEMAEFTLERNLASNRELKMSYFISDVRPDSDTPILFHISEEMSEFEIGTVPVEPILKADGIFWLAHDLLPSAKTNTCNLDSSRMEGRMIHKNWAELIKPTQLAVDPGNTYDGQIAVIGDTLGDDFGMHTDDAGAPCSQPFRNAHDFLLIDCVGYTNALFVDCSSDAFGAGREHTEYATVYYGGAGIGGTVQIATLNSCSNLQEGEAITFAVNLDTDRRDEVVLFFGLSDALSLNDSNYEFVTNSGNAFSNGAGNILVGGGNDIAHHGAGSALTDCDDDAFFDVVDDILIGGVRSFALSQKDLGFTRTPRRSASAIDRTLDCDWCATAKQSKTYGHELFRKTDHIMHKTYIDDSMYPLYISSRSNDLGQFGGTQHRNPD